MSEIEPRFPHIRELREDANLSQEGIASVLNCSVDYLLGLTNQKKP